MQSKKRCFKVWAGSFVSGVTLVLLTVFTIGCNGENPVTVNPQATGVSQLALINRIAARYNPDTSQVWVGAPPGWAVPASLIEIQPQGQSATIARAMSDGSFLYRYTGSQGSYVFLHWLDPSGERRELNLQVTDPNDELELNLGSAGLYPNRMMVNNNLVWVVNSGDDELTSYDIHNLLPTIPGVSLSQYSNPWEVEFLSASEGIITTLFAGVYKFNALINESTPVSTAGFRDFASPNGVTILGEYAWVVNPNPISYFPTEFGEGWVSKIELGGNPIVVDEIDTPWLNPQYAITDGESVYVSCSGTIDFLPPDYVATALDNGGVLVIDPDTGQINKTYELGMCGPGTMALSPDGRYLYVGSGVAGWVFRIDLENELVLNDASNPIVISDFEGTYVPFLVVNGNGLMACGSFNTDTVHFLDSWTGEINPFPFFEPVELHPDEPDLLFGIQDAKFLQRYGESGLLVLTSVKSEFHWLPI